jgi:SAM-dependent methyltransferase
VKNLTLKPIIDHVLFHQRRQRAVTSNVSGADFLLKHVANEMDERLSLVKKQFKNPVQVQGYTQYLANLISNRGQGKNFRFIENLKIDANTDLIENEVLPLIEEQSDLILSTLSLQLTNDTPGYFAQIHKALKPDGLFMAASLGAGTLNELRQSLLIAESEIYNGASARVIPFADIQDYGGLLQRTKFALPVIDGEVLTVRYDDIFALMWDLRAMGMTNSLIQRSKKPVSKAFFNRANEIYKEQFSDPDGRIRASFAIVYLAGWKPHQSQQKPLRPGSAKTRLSDALNVDEIKLKNK